MAIAIAIGTKVTFWNDQILQERRVEGVVFSVSPAEGFPRETKEDVLVIVGPKKNGVGSNRYVRLGSEVQVSPFSKE